MHVPIKAPTEHPADYFNRNKYHSIVLQGVCDYRYCLTDVFFGFAGRVHDARVLANSTFYDLGMNGRLLPNRPRRIAGEDVPLVIIGDPAYPLLPWLMKPFGHRGQLNRAQQRFNYRLSRARMTIENTFGRLKGRWRCLLKKNEFTLDKIHTVVLACCILHNVCEIHKEPFHNRWLEAVRLIEGERPLRIANQIIPQNRQEIVANATREAFVRHFNR
jgi:hypothetical protein